MKIDMFYRNIKMQMQYRLHSTTEDDIRFKAFSLKCFDLL